VDLSIATWRKSGRSSGAQGSNCVEVAFVAEQVGVRDSKNADGGHLVFDRAAWAYVLGGMTRG
jgi:hypothetical protein